MKKVSTDDCWLWAGRIRYDDDPQRDYGVIDAYGRSLRAHRAVYEALIGEVPEGLVLDHLCQIKRCINPEHLEPVTQGENIRRSDIARGRPGGFQNICRRGHERTPENLYTFLWRGKTSYACKECVNLRKRERRAIKNNAGASPTLVGN